MKISINENVVLVQDGTGEETVSWSMDVSQAEKHLSTFKTLKAADAAAIRDAAEAARESVAEK